MHLPHTTATLVELMALRQGLLIVIFNDFMHYIIDTNSIAVIHMLDKDPPCYFNIRNECSHC